MDSIVSTLGVGSGIDTAALIIKLVDADRQARTTPLTKRSDALTAQISALGQIKAALAGIGTSLASRVSSGALGLQPASSASSVATVERRGTGPLAPFSSSLTVTALAAGQRLVAAPLAGADAPVGLGTLSFGFGRRTALPDGSFSFASGSVPGMDVTITAANNSLTGLRDAINAAGGPVAASIVNTGSGAALSLKGRDGADFAYVVSAAENVASPGLARFGYTPGNAQLSLSSSAADAAMVLDGVSVTRSSNVIDDLLTGTRLQLQSTGAVTLDAARDATNLSATVSDMTVALAAMRSLIGDFRKGATDDAAAGALATDATARTIDQRITNLIGAPVAAANGLRLRDLGVSVSRTGVIEFDATRLAALPAARAADAELLLRSLSSSARGQTQSLQSIAELATPATAGLTRRKTGVTTDLAKIEARLVTYKDTLTRQYAAMDRLVAASKAVGTQLDQQIKIWTKSN